MHSEFITCKWMDFSTKFKNRSWEDSIFFFQWSEKNPKKVILTPEILV